MIIRLRNTLTNQFWNKGWSRSKIAKTFGRKSDLVSSLNAYNSGRTTPHEQLEVWEYHEEKGVIKTPFIEWIKPKPKTPKPFNVFFRDNKMMRGDYHIGTFERYTRVNSQNHIPGTTVLETTLTFKSLYPLNHGDGAVFTNTVGIELFMSPRWFAEVIPLMNKGVISGEFGFVCRGGYVSLKLLKVKE